MSVSSPPVIHLSVYSDQPNVQILCSGAWGQPEWGKAGPLPPALPEEVYRLDNGCLYTFVLTLATCPLCIAKATDREVVSKIPATTWIAGAEHQCCVLASASADPIPTKVVEGVCVAVASEFDTSLYFFRPADYGRMLADVVQATDLLPEAAVIPWGVLVALESIGSEQGSMFADHLARWREEHGGRMLPPIYRTKITVEHVEVPEAEAKELWAAWAKRGAKDIP